MRDIDEIIQSIRSGHSVSADEIDRVKKNFDDELRKARRAIAFWGLFFVLWAAGFVWASFNVFG